MQFSNARWRVRLQTDTTGERSLFFSRNWIYCAVLVALVGVAVGQQAVALVGFIVLATAGFSALWNRASLGHIQYDCTLSSHLAFPDDAITCTVTIGNQKPLPVPRFSIELEMSIPLLPTDRASTTGGVSSRRILHFETGLRPFERKSWTIPLICQARGAHTIGPATLRTGDPFGFFANRRTIVARQEVVVYPRTFEFGDRGFQPRRPLGEFSVLNRIVTDPLRVAGVRDYRPEDPFRSIHWKASARLGTLQVKVNDPVTSLALVIFVNLDTFSHYWEGLNLVAAERTIEIAASLARTALAAQHPVALFANGIVAGTDQPLRLPYGRGPAQESQIMTGLARLWPFSTIPFAHLLKAEARRIPPGTVVGIVTPMMSAAIEHQIASVVESGITTVLFPVDEMKIPSIRGLQVTYIDDVNPLPAAEDLVA